MPLKEKIKEDLNEAVKKIEEPRTTVLRLLLATVLNREKEKRYKISKSEQNLTEKELQEKSELSDEEIITAIAFEVKKRKESILEFGKGKREDLVEKEKKEMEILQKYLPEQLSEEELKKLVKEAIEKLEAKEIKDIRTSPSARTLNASRIFGKVMAELMPKIRGRAPGDLVSRIVRELLIP